MLRFLRLVRKPPPPDLRTGIRWWFDRNRYVIVFTVAVIAAWVLYPNIS